ncbi:LysR family transcriptional regulator [Agrobacterium sp. MOPV5]|uniref:LysR family transcriptional regulator n=1 Tax=Agrobacterium leguminum TaxID=2792015 RepID=UPI0018C295B6|nr:LysR family transcriptional regulator [Agrobacterium leguminum]MBG0512124.1 LysR family transcriptional regulator [Agrobacterium leguminum]
MDLLQSIRVFIKVADFGNFTRAAENLQVGRPQVTIIIKELEDSLGVRLFQRTTRKVTMTSEGEAFYERAETILGSVSEATSMFGQIGAPLRGKLRIDIPSAFAQTGFFESLRDFTRTYPDIELTLGVTDRNVDMVAEGVDCVLRIGELKDSSLVARRVGSAVMVTCAAPRYLDEFGEPKSLQDLSDHRCVNFLSGASRRPISWHFFEGGTATQIAPKSAILVNDSHAYVECGVAGFGIVQVPGIIVDRYLNDGRLKEILSPYRPTPRPVSVLYPSKQYLAPQVRIFIDWIQARFAALNGQWLTNVSTGEGKSAAEDMTIN